MAADPDFKSGPRVRNPLLLRSLHLEWRECALGWAGIFEDDCEPMLSLHHIHRHPRDDVRGNLVMLCGSGTTGHHGAVTVHAPAAIEALRGHLLAARPDVVEYLAEKLGGREAATQWLQGAL